MIFVPVFLDLEVRAFTDPYVLGDGQPAAVGTFSQPRFEAGEQPVELGHIVGVELRTRGTHRGRPIAPRRQRISLRAASPNPGCCSWRTSGR